LLIAVLGVGMPVFAILCSLILCRLSQKKQRLSVVAVSSKKKGAELDTTEPAKKKSDLIENNLFKPDALEETKICVRAISSSTPTKGGLKLVENSVYSVFHSGSLNRQSQVNEKNLANLRANFCQADLGNEYGLMASMV